ncbi:hypothetical protein [Plantactinospora sp. CA-290183]|uniref:hypothetical protein n=1 Tax=Plantactinospora sp. CA-290183 TaxID=3240006 RepID=UPI003D934C7A
MALDDLPGHSGSTAERLSDGSLADVDAEPSRGEGDGAGPRPSAVGVLARCSCGWTGPTEHRPDEMGRLSATSDWVAHMRPLWEAAPPAWLLNRSESLRETVIELTGTWPLQALGVLAHLERWQRTATEDAVARARQAGSSWADIGAVLGITRQSAHERFKQARTTGHGSRSGRRPAQP